MRVTWAAAAVLWGGLVACGFYDAVPRPSDPFGPSVPLPNLPDASIAIPDGGEVIIGDGGSRDHDGGIHIPGGDGGSTLPDGGLPPDGGVDAGLGCGELTPGVEVLARGEYFPSTLALSPTEVFWVDRNLALRRTFKAGGSVTTAWTLASEALQVDAEAAYVVIRENGYTLMKVPYGGPTRPLQSWSNWTPGLGELVQSGGMLYADVDDDLFAVAKDGTSSRVLRAGGYREALTADDAGVYFSELGAQDLWFIPAAGGDTTRLATLAEGLHAPRMHASPAGLAVMVEPVRHDSSDCPGGHLMRGGGSAVGLTELTRTIGCVLELTTDATHAYWTTFVPGTGFFLFRAPLAGGGSQALAQLPDANLGLAVDEAFVYWGQPQPGCILRVPKQQ